MPLGTRGLWTLSVAVGVGGAAVLSGAGFARPADPPAAEKKDAAKADDKKPAYDAKDVRVGPPPELAALREAVEEAAKKGENVDEIRKQLDALEKALAGKAWVKPKPVEEPPAPPAFPNPAPVFPGRVRPLPVRPFPGGMGGLNQPDMEMLQKAQDLLVRAAQLALEDPVANREKAEALQREAQDLLTKALGAGAFGGGAFGGGAFGGGAFGGDALGGGLLMPLIPGGGVRNPNNPRLGVIVEKVPEGIAEKGGIPAGQGVLVADVLPGTAADRAGLEVNDVIIEFAGKPVADDPTGFVRSVGLVRKGAKVDIVYVRNGKKAEAKGVPLGNGGAAARPGGDADRLPDDDLPPRAIPAPAKRASVSVKVQDGAFTINADQDGVKIVVEGTAADGKSTPSRIEITDGAKKVEAKSVDQLPAGYRDRVQKLIDGVQIGK